MYSGAFDAGLFFTFSLYAQMVFRPIADLAERYNVLQLRCGWRRIFDILDRERERLSTWRNASTPSNPLNSIMSGLPIKRITGSCVAYLSQ